MAIIQPYSLIRLARLLAALLITALASACTFLPSTMPTTPTGNALRVENAWARPSPMQGGNGAVYLTVLNPTNRPDQLLGVSSPVARVAETHETVEKDSVVRMEPRPEGFAIPAQGSLLLKPGGKHIMLVDLVAPLQAGQSISVTLEFEQAGTVALDVPVRAGNQN